MWIIYLLCYFGLASEIGRFFAILICTNKYTSHNKIRIFSFHYLTLELRQSPEKSEYYQTEVQSHISHLYVLTGYQLLHFPSVTVNFKVLPHSSEREIVF